MANVSIGAIGQPYYDEFNGRVKAFCPKVFHSLREVSDYLRSIQSFPHDGMSHRTSVRVFLSNEVSDEEFCKYELSCTENSFFPEGRIYSTREHLDFSIAYFGRNYYLRQNPHQVSAENSLLNCVLQRTPNGHEYLEDINFGCYFPSEALYSTEDIQDVLEIYQKSFKEYLAEFTFGSVYDMLRSTVSACVRISGKIVAIGVAELAEVSVEGSGLSVKLAEISEVATHPQFRSQGYSHLVYNALLKKLNGNLDFVFTEARANHYGILAVAYDAGMLPVGMLEQHCVISSDAQEVVQQSQYGNLVVFSSTSNDFVWKKEMIK